MKRNSIVTVSVAVAAALFLDSASVRGEESIPPKYAADAVPGAFTVDPPTLSCLGFHWALEGDDNRNATADVVFREKGTSDWKHAQSLLRVGGFHVGRHWDWLDHVPPNGLAGSVMDLKADTEYEVKITVKDPDGVIGDAVQTTTARTRAVPITQEGGRVFHVCAPGGTHVKGAFGNLYKAYYGGGGNLGDFNLVWERPVQPGDTILVHAGTYKADLTFYTDKTGLVADGTYWLTAKGTKEKPITIKAAGDGEVIFDGSGADVLFNVMAADHHIFDGITFRNCGTAIFAGQQRVGGCVGLTVRNCRFEDVRDGIYTLFNGATDFLIADNVFLGRNARDGLTGWGTAEEGFLKSNTAITLQGSGHVVSHNAIAYFWQGFHMGTAFQGFDKGGIACDIHNNDLFMLIDDGIEVDGCGRNVRVFRNRIVEAGSPISVQPCYGGPVYFIRNAAYGRGRTGMKIHEAWPSGMIFFHNTIIANTIVSRGTYTVAMFRNNLFLPAGEKTEMVFPSDGHGVSADYDGYGPTYFTVMTIDGKAPIMNKGVEPFEALKPYPSKKDAARFDTPAELGAATGLEMHGVAVDYSVFAALQPPPKMTKRVAIPVTQPSALRFELNPSGAAVDAGVALANINDGFHGKAPDLGAYESGQQPPKYGPRYAYDLTAMPNATKVASAKASPEKPREVYQAQITDGKALIEAEDVTSATGMQNESAPGYSNAKIARVAPGQRAGTLVFEVNGGDGLYGVSVVYVDERDGDCEYALAVDGKEIGTWRSDAPGGGQGKEPESRKVKTIPRVPLALKSKVSLTVTLKQGQEFGRVDSIELRKE